MAKKAITQEELEVHLRKGEKIFKNLDLRGLDFGYYKISQKTFINCDLSNANFIISDLYDNTISDCAFTNCDISFTKFKDIMRCDFYNCKGYETSFKKSEITETDFTLCDLEKADFSKSNVMDTSFNHCTIKDSIFRDSELFTFKACNNTQFFYSYFDMSKLTNCEFADVMIYGNILRETNINDSYFFDTKIVESSLKNSNFKNNLFYDSDMVSNHFDNIKFTECNLTKSHFIKSTGLKTCIFNECLCPPEIKKDTRIEDLSKELIKEQDFYKAYVLMELNDAIPVPDLPSQFMKEVVKRHGIDKQVLKKAIESVGIRDDMHQEDMGKLLTATLNSNEYKEAFDKVQSKTANVKENGGSYNG